MFTIDTDKIEGSFKGAAENLFNNHVLQVGKRYYRLLEIEFYYQNKSADHEDHYCHGHDEQLKWGTWYFHGSGLDITFGGGQGSEIYGGVLIRSVQWLNPDSGTDKKWIDVFGPLRVVTALMAGFPGVTDGAPFTFYLRDLNKEPLKDIPALERQDVHRAPRIGLNEKKDEGRDNKYHSKPYRFLIHPHLGHKNKQQIADQMYIEKGSKPEALDEIKRLLGSEFLKDKRRDHQ